MRTEAAGFLRVAAGARWRAGDFSASLSAMNQVKGIVFILLGAVPLYMVVVRGAQFMLPAPVSYVISGAMILWGVMLLFRRAPPPA